MQCTADAKKENKLMRIDRSRMNTEEKVMVELHALYQKFGYSRYKMGKFEEYDLYVRNKDFIPTESIIAFSDMNGKLMALKPDLTLSIVKNYRYAPGFVQKVYYSENIYRASQSAHSHREIMQTGLECMGDIDMYQIFEVTMLAARSLAAISRDYVLEISHMGLIADILHPLDEDVRSSILRCIGEKNIHEIKSIGREHNIDENIIRSLEILVSTYGDYKKVIRRLSELPLGEQGREALSQLSQVLGLMAQNKMAGKVNIDFSIVNDLTYYSGFLYKGFVNGVPKAVLSGGQYDKLMGRMEKKGGALGFAVYLDNLDRLDADEKNYDVDLVFIYDDDDDIQDIYRTLRDYSASGQSVIVEKAVPDKLRYKRMIKLRGKEVVTIEQND